MIVFFHIIWNYREGERERERERGREREKEKWRVGKERGTDNKLQSIHDHYKYLVARIIFSSFSR